VTPNRAKLAQEQKFFGSFFQKRTFLLIASANGETAFVPHAHARARVLRTGRVGETSFLD
jgi:hypothetical protein